MLVREVRAVKGGDLRVLVMGKVWHYVIERDRHTSQVIHEFDDSGDEFRAMIAGTFHPIAQLMECPCGSGDRFVDCHLVDLMDQPCPCRKPDVVFANCCMIDTEADR